MAVMVTAQCAEEAIAAGAAKPFEAEHDEERARGMPKAKAKKPKARKAESNAGG